MKIIPASLAKISISSLLVKVFLFLFLKYYRNTDKFLLFNISFSRIQAKSLLNVFVQELLFLCSTRWHITIPKFKEYFSQTLKLVFWGQRKHKEQRKNLNPTLNYTTKSYSLSKFSQLMASWGTWINVNFNLSTF